MSSSGYTRAIAGAGVGDTPQWAALAFGSITGTTAATANTVLTLTRDQYFLKVENTTGVDLVITVKTPTQTAAVDYCVIRTTLTDAFDAGANLTGFPTGTIVGVYRRSGAPAAGECIVSAR